VVLRQPSISTAHAFDRVRQRLSLSHAEVAAILDNDQAVLVSVDGFSNRLRRAFYSVPDKEFFVAVQDANNGAVITVLTLEYHANLRWPIREKHLGEAARLVGHAPPDLRRMVGVSPKMPRTVIRVSCTVPGSGGDFRLRNLGSWPAASAPEDRELLSQDSDFMEAIHARLQAKGIAGDERITLHLRLGKDEERVDIDLDPGRYSSARRQGGGARAAHSNADNRS